MCQFFSPINHWILDHKLIYEVYKSYSPLKWWKKYAIIVYTRGSCNIVENKKSKNKGNFFTIRKSRTTEYMSVIYSQCISQILTKLILLCKIILPHKILPTKWWIWVNFFHLPNCKSTAPLIPSIPLFSSVQF